MVTALDKISIKKDLTVEELGFLESEMLKNRKSKEAAWGLWVGLSFFGAHRFYTENYMYASAMFITTFLPLLVIIILLFNNIYNFLMGFSLFLIIGSVIWSWVDAFFLNSRVNEFNNDIELKIVNNIIKNR